MSRPRWRERLLGELVEWQHADFAIHGDGSKAVRTGPYGKAEIERWLVAYNDGHVTWLADEDMLFSGFLIAE